MNRPATLGFRINSFFNQIIFNENGFLSKSAWLSIEKQQIPRCQSQLKQSFDFSKESWLLTSSFYWKLRNSEIYKLDQIYKSPKTWWKLIFWRHNKCQKSQEMRWLDCTLKISSRHLLCALHEFLMAPDLWWSILPIAPMVWSVQLIAAAVSSVLLIALGVCLALQIALVVCSS